MLQLPVNQLWWFCGSILKLQRSAVTAIISLSILLGVVFGIVLISRMFWWIFVRVMDPLLEKARDSVKAEKINNIYDYQQRARAAWSAQLEDQKRRQRESRRFVTPDGTNVSLDLEGQRRLLWRCLNELGLPTNASWKEIKSGWRKQVFRWHPDRGGDPEIWLVKLRSYEALESLKELID